MNFFDLITLSTTFFPGSLYYFLTLSVWIIAAFLAFYAVSKDNPQKNDWKIYTGLAVLFSLRILLMFLFGSVSNPVRITAPIERAILLMDILIISWVWLSTHEGLSRQDLTYAILALAIIVLGFLSSLVWMGFSGRYYNVISGDQANILELGWGGLVLILGLGTIAKIITQKPSGFRFVLACVLILVAGVGAHFLFISYFQTLDYPVFLRLAYLFSFPILFSLGLTKERDVEMVLFEVSEQDSELELTEIPKLQQSIEEVAKEHLAWLELGAHRDTYPDLCRWVVKALGQALRVDICLLLNLNDNGSLFISCGYDLISEEFVEPRSLYSPDFVQTVASLKGNRFLMLPAGDDSPDLQGLAQRLYLRSTGDLIIYPFSKTGSANLGLALFSPYSFREWTTDDKKYLEIITPRLLDILLRSDDTSLEPSTLVTENDQVKFSQDQLITKSLSDPGSFGDTINPRQELSAEYQEQVQSLYSENQSLKLKIFRLEEEIKGISQYHENEFEEKGEENQTLLDHQEGENLPDRLEGKLEQYPVKVNYLELDNQRLTEKLQEIQLLKNSMKFTETHLANLVEENISLREVLEGKRMGDKHTQSDINHSAKEELRLALLEIAELNNRINQLQLANRPSLSPSKNTSVEKPATKSLKIENSQKEYLFSISQELRQPLSSIFGYTDLLMGESVGILGSMQKKFVDQIKISTLKLNSLINNLVNITTIQRIEDRTKLGAYDVCGIIDEALIESNPIIRNKKLVLRMNLPGDLPEITTDQQILKETVSGLILNASQVSPEGSNLTVTVQLNKGFLDEDYFLIQITDSGGGIEPEDLIHVYTEVNEPLRIIHGISNVDIDFSLIKDQIEEINGRVWVDSVPGEGTVFSILLPVT